MPFCFGRRATHGGQAVSLPVVSGSRQDVPPAGSLPRGARFPLRSTGTLYPRRYGTIYFEHCNESCNEEEK